MAKHAKQDNGADSARNAADRYRRSNYSESAAYYDSQRSDEGAYPHAHIEDENTTQAYADLSGFDTFVGGAYDQQEFEQRTPARHGVRPVSRQNAYDERDKTAVYPRANVRQSAYANGYAAPAAQQVARENPYAYAQPSPYGGQAAYAVPAGYKAVEIPQRKRKGRVGKVVLGVLLVLLLVGGGLWFWFSSQLDAALSKGTDQAALDRVLDDAELGKPFYVLVMGSDSREGSGTSSKVTESGDYQRSDVIILVRVDASKRLVTMLSIPRDTPYVLNGEKVKINETYNQGGAPATIKAVSEITGVPISHFAEVHFSELGNIVDALGGVTVDVNRELGYADALTGEWVTLQPGTQKINGQQAQIFARARHEYENYQDASRQSNVRALATAIMKNILERPFTEIPGKVIEVAQYVGTDVKSGDLVALATMFVLPGPDVTVYSGTGPYDGEIDPETGMWLCFENPEGWERVMDVVDSGGDPSTVSYGY